MIPKIKSLSKEYIEEIKNLEYLENDFIEINLTSDLLLTIQLDMYFTGRGENLRENYYYICKISEYGYYLPDYIHLKRNCSDINEINNMIKAFWKNK